MKRKGGLVRRGWLVREAFERSRAKRGYRSRTKDACAYREGRRGGWKRVVVGGRHRTWKWKKPRGRWRVPPRRLSNATWRDTGGLVVLLEGWKTGKGKRGGFILANAFARSLARQFVIDFWIFLALSKIDGFQIIVIKRSWSSSRYCKIGSKLEATYIYIFRVKIQHQVLSLVFVVQR